MDLNFLKLFSRKVLGDSRWRAVAFLTTLVSASIMAMGGMMCAEESSPSAPSAKNASPAPVGTPGDASDSDDANDASDSDDANDASDSDDITGARDPYVLGRYMDELIPNGEEHTEEGLPDRWGSLSWDDGAKLNVRGPKCMFGGSYKTYYRRSLNDNNDRVVLYLGPGGACFDALTCLVPYQLSGGNISFVSLDAAAPLDQEDSGILSSKEGVSPLHALPVVFAPYCDGSVFSGDNDVEYESPVSAPEPSSKTAYHRGLQNLSAAVATVQRKFSEAPKEIVILGSSAGGMGILTALGLVHEVFPETDIFVYSDSAPPIFSPRAKAGLSGIFKNWNLKEQLPAECDNCDGPSFYPVISHYLGAIPEIKRIGFSGFSQDAVISAYTFFDTSGLGPLIEGLSKVSGGAFNFGEAMTKAYIGTEGPLGIDVFEETFLSESKKVADAFSGRVKRFIKKGQFHMMLYHSPPASGTNQLVGEMKAYDWLEQLIVSDEGWSNQIEE